jgi:hypothetical protein
MTAKRAGRIDQDVERFVDAALRSGISVTNILTGGEREFPDRPPSRRYIYRRREKIIPRDASGPWVMSLADPAEIALVPPVVADLITATTGAIRGVTVNEARQITAIRLGAPDLPLQTTYFLAREYVVRGEQARDTTDLDLILAFAPWRSDADATRWESAIQNDWVPEPPAFLHELVMAGEPHVEKRLARIFSGEGSGLTTQQMMTTFKASTRRMAREKQEVNDGDD